MELSELRAIIPSNLDDEKAVYDIDSHIHIPKLDYVMKKTGVDMIQGVGGDENVANGTMRFLAEFTMNTIKALTPPVSRPMLEFLCAKDADRRKAFLDVVCSLVTVTRGKGLAELLGSGDIDQSSLPKVVQITAQASGLLVKYYSRELPQEYIRENY